MYGRLASFMAVWYYLLPFGAFEKLKCGNPGLNHMYVCTYYVCRERLTGFAELDVGPEQNWTTV
jgi:hypothetical protein